MRRLRILFVFGTRPEAIKLCPVIRLFRGECGDEFDVRICVTAQHRAMLDQVLDVFRVQPDYDLNAMRPGQTLTSATSLILSELESVITADAPDLVLVQGDTATTLCGALAAFYARIPVGHVEAGLRTGDLGQPFPEEMNRVVVGRLSSVHFAATPWAESNLRAEGVEPRRIAVTGNTGIDAVLYIRDCLERGEIRGREWPELDPDRKLIVVTAHRRESFGDGFEQICTAIREIADLPDVQLLYPVHPNPNVTEPVRRLLSGHPNIRLIEPLDYISFVDLMRRAYLLVTDSGGVQEEAPSLGKPVLVLREKTERPEAVEAGTATLVGTDVRKIVENASLLVRDTVEYDRRRRIHNPYGDGKASGRIAAFIRESLPLLTATGPRRT
jgi:UDP-N-acetylglucosamine 2-epimerase (non-hydrolysing)